MEFEQFLDYKQKYQTHSRQLFIPFLYTLFPLHVHSHHGLSKIIHCTLILVIHCWYPMYLLRLAQGGGIIYNYVKGWQIGGHLTLWMYVHDATSAMELQLCTMYIVRCPVKILITRDLVVACHTLPLKKQGEMHTLVHGAILFSIHSLSPVSCTMKEAISTASAKLSHCFLPSF